MDGGRNWLIASEQDRERMLEMDTRLRDVRMIAFGVLTVVGGLHLAANQPTPWLGVYERIMLYAFMLWVAVLAVTLLRESGEPYPRSAAP